MLEIDILFNKRLHVRHIWNWKLWRIFHCNVGYLLGIFTCLRRFDYWCWLVIHIISSIGSLVKLKPEWTSLRHAKSTNSTTMYYTSTMSSPTNCTYSSIDFFSLQDSLVKFIGKSSFTIENVVLEHTCDLTRMVIATWPHLHLSSPTYNCHRFNSTCVRKWGYAAMTAPVKWQVCSRLHNPITLFVVLNVTYVIMSLTLFWGIC